jgi:hypothetical protein
LNPEQPGLREQLAQWSKPLPPETPPVGDADPKPPAAKAAGESESLLTGPDKGADPAEKPAGEKPKGP